MNPDESFYDQLSDEEIVLIDPNCIITFPEDRIIQEPIDLEDLIF